MPIDLHWLPRRDSVEQQIGELQEDLQAAPWSTLLDLANQRLTPVETNALDRLMRLNRSSAPLTPVHLAVLSSSTISHLLPAIRVAAVRRGLWFETFEGEPGNYAEELLGNQSPLYKFQPVCLLLLLDSRHLAEEDSGGGNSETFKRTLELVQSCWTAARRLFDCAIFQSTLLPIFDPLLGNNEWRLNWSPAGTVARMNAALRMHADKANVNLIAIDERVAQDGLPAWYNPMLWFRTRQEIHPRAAPIFGELVARAIGAELGCSRKCLVLDLDNILWGGVIGEVGVEGIRLGNTTAIGEAYSAFQRYLVRLSKRGVILAVCSKNDEKAALAPFEEQHPGMFLRRSDIAHFCANWRDKAENLEKIAQTLNIGLDSMVFVDDNPYERTLVRRKLPTVAVPELPRNPFHYAQCLAAAGYFEALFLTTEDERRSQQYWIAAERTLPPGAPARSPSDDDWNETLYAGPFTDANIRRVVQLINRTNQFNFTIKRYSEAHVRRLMADPRTVTLQVGLSDPNGDAGIIAAVIGRENHDTLDLDTFVMSCRMLGREIEHSVLDLVVGAALSKGLCRIIGQYKPTARNGVIRDLYARLGFTLMAEAPDGSSVWELNLDGYEPRRRKHLVGRCNFERWLERRAAREIS